MNPFMAMNPMMNPMEYLAMMSQYNQMFLNNIGAMNHQNPQTQQTDYSKQKDLQKGKVDEILSKNMQDLNKFYQYIDNQNRDSETPTPKYSSTHHDFPQQSFPSHQSQQSLQSLQSHPQPDPKHQSHFSDFPSKSPTSSADFSHPPDDRRYPPDDRRYPSDDRPIRPQENFNNPEDDRPIRPATRNQPQEFDDDDRPLPKKKGLREQEVNQRGSNRELRESRDSERQEEDEPEWRQNDYHDEFDDLPITGKAKRFEDLLEEQLRADPNAVAKGGSRTPKRGKTKFLKRGTGHVSSAAFKPATKSAPKDQKENIEDFVTLGGNVLQTKKSNNAPHEKPFPGNKFETFDTFEDQTDKKKSKEPKKFLTKGGGRGGGVGTGKSDSDAAEESKGNRPVSRKNDVRVPETTYDRIKSAKY